MKRDSRKVAGAELPVSPGRIPDYSDLLRAREAFMRAYAGSRCRARRESLRALSGSPGRSDAYAADVRRNLRQALGEYAPAVVSAPVLVRSLQVHPPEHESLFLRRYRLRRAAHCGEDLHLTEILPNVKERLPLMILIGDALPRLEGSRRADPELPVRPGLAQEEVLALAPERAGLYFVVPPILGEHGN